MSVPPGTYMPNSHHKAALLICDFCFRQCGGFCIQHMADRQYPIYHTCSDICDDVMLALVIRGRGYAQADLIRRFHAQAVIDARLEIHKGIEALMSASLPLVGAANMDGITQKVMASIMESMRQQSALTAPGEAVTP
jgi:hypothetical protein